MSTAGFVTATLRAATTVGGIAATPIPPTVYLPPDKPLNLAGSVTTGSTFWSAYCDAATTNDDYPVIGYYWYENGVLVGQSVTPEFTKLGRTPSTAYTITAKSYTIGAVSDLSDPLVITTDASGGVDPTPDVTPPTAPVITSAVATGPYSFTVSYSTSSDSQSGVAWYIVQADGNDLTAVVHPGTTASWGALPYAGRLYKITVVALDNAGNRSAPSNEVSITTTGAIVTPPPGRTVSGTITDGAAYASGAVTNAPPSPPGRAISGTPSTAVQTASGTIANTPPGADLPPVWTTPSVDTVYDFMEGDTVDIPVAATDPEGNVVTISEATGVYPTGTAFGVNAQSVPGIRGVLSVGTGGYPAPVEYDIYLDASDVVAVPLPAISTTSLPTATVGIAYSATLQATDGYGPPYYWVLTTVLPSPLDQELSIDPNTGVFSGTPSVTYGGLLTFTATDPQSNVATKQLQFDVYPDVSMTDTPEGMWAAQVARPGRMLAKRLDNLTDIGPGDGGPTPGMMNNSAFREGRWALDLTKGVFGTGCLRLDVLDTSGQTACQWSHYIDGVGSRRFYQVGDEFWWQVAFLLNEAAMYHYPLLDPGQSAGNKIVILDRFRQTAGVKEAVWINSRARGYMTSYLGLTQTQPWGQGAIQRDAPGSDFYLHPAFDAGSPANPTTWPERKQRYGPVRYNTVTNDYVSATTIGAGLPDPDIGSPVFSRTEFFVATGHIKIRSLNGEDGIYQVWGNLYRQPPKLLISQTNANFRADSVEAKNSDDTTSGNLGYNGINLTNFQTRLNPDSGRPTMSTYYQYALTDRDPILHPGPNGLVALPGVIDA